MDDEEDTGSREIYDKPDISGIEGERIPSPEHEEGRQRPGAPSSTGYGGSPSRRGKPHEPVYGDRGDSPITNNLPLPRRSRGEHTEDPGRRFGFGRERRGGHGRGKTDGELSEGEGKAGVSDRGKVGKDEASLEDFAKDAMAAAELAGGRYGKAIAWLAKRKKKAGGVSIVVGLIFMVIFAFNIIQGPLQVIHMGQVLGKAFTDQDTAAEIREKGLVRWFRSGNIGETRVGLLGSEITKRALAKLEAEGITFEVDANTGHLKGVNIDQARNSMYGDMSVEDARTQIAKDNGIPLDKVTHVSGDNGSAKFKITDIGDLSRLSSRDVISQSFDSAGFGRTARLVAFRPVADFLGKPSILHPWKILKEKVRGRFFSSEATKQLVQEEKNNQTSITEESPETKALVDDERNALEEQSRVRSATSVAIGLQAGICLAREVANRVPDINWGTVVQPAASLATFAMAEGSQTQAGDDLVIQQPGATVLNYVSKAGQTVWESLPLQILAGKVNPGGIDLPDEYKQAFSFASTSANIVKTLDKYGANYLCSTVAQIGGAIAGVALIATGPGGTITSKLLSSGGQLIAGAVVANAIVKFLPKLIASEAPPVTTLTGPLGGGFAAFGAMAMNNMSSASFGGTVLSSNERTTLQSYNDKMEQQKLKSESFATRIFNPYNSGSLVANIIDYQTLNPVLNFSNLIGSFVNPMRIFSTFSNAIFPKAYAEIKPEQVQYWEKAQFKELGISLKDLQDPKYDNPDNADAAAKILDAHDEYVDKALTCFGDKISKGSQGWDVEQVKAVNPASSEYQEAGCGDGSVAWTRIRFLVFDTLLAKGDVCYHGDEEVCKELHIDSAGEASVSGGSTGSLPTGSAQDLASQLLPYIKDGKISCNNQASNCPDIQNTAKGGSLKGGACYVNALDPKLLGMILELVKMGHKFVFSAICSDHPSNPASYHHLGKAADFNYVDGVFMGSAGEGGPWTGNVLSAGKKLDSDVASFMPKSTGFGQKNCHPTFNFLQGFDVFDDLCHHQHIQVED